MDEREESAPIRVARTKFDVGRVFVAGHRGVVGSAILTNLEAANYEVVVTTRQELDLTNLRAVGDFLSREKVDTVVLAAAKVGGIQANIADPVGFLTENLAIQTGVMLGSVEANVSTLMFLGSSCIYPRNCPQPMREVDYLTGPLEPTNESYAIAKIAGIRLAQAIGECHGIRILLPMPSNVYGPGDHFDLARAHVLSSLVRRFDDATRHGMDAVTLWGTGQARREFLYTTDLADACRFLLEYVDGSGIINIGSGVDLSIKNLASLVAEAVGFHGTINWDTAMPSGMPRKLMDSSRLYQTGWSPSVTLTEGLPTVVRDYRERFPPSPSQRFEGGNAIDG